MLLPPIKTVAKLKLASHARTHTCTPPCKWNGNSAHSRHSLIFPPKKHQTHFFLPFFHPTLRVYVCGYVISIWVKLIAYLDAPRAANTTELLLLSFVYHKNCTSIDGNVTTKYINNKNIKINKTGVTTQHRINFSTVGSD